MILADLNKSNKQERKEVRSVFFLVVKALEEDSALSASLFPPFYSPPLPHPALSAIHECDQLLCLSIGA